MITPHVETPEPKTVFLYLPQEFVPAVSALLDERDALRAQLAGVVEQVKEQCAKLADDYLKGACPASTMALYLPDAIRAIDLTEAPKGEPVAWMNLKFGTLHPYSGPEDWNTVAYKCGELQPLYASPQAAAGKDKEDAV